MKVYLVYLSDNPYGGWMTYTRHLYDALRTNDVDVKVIKIKETVSFTDRNFGYGLTYRSYDLEVLKAVAGNEPILVTAVQKNQAAYLNSMLKWPNVFMVIHDNNEVKHICDMESARGKAIVIRQANLHLAPEATFIPHPYKPWSMKEYTLNRPVWARSVSRIDFDKNTAILLDANRLLPEQQRIDIRGFENRIYTRFTIMPKYPEWVQSKAAFPREEGAAVKLLEDVRFMVDMSTIKGDGGGSQYTFLEAIDAGAMLIVNNKWYEGMDMHKVELVPDVHCLAVEPTGQALADAICFTTEVKRVQIVHKARELLKLHDPIIIGSQYVDFFERHI